MKDKKTDFCKIKFFSHYVIITFDKEVVLDVFKAQELRAIFKEHYVNEDFILIANREYDHQVTKEVYKEGQLKNMKGLAIVSNKKTARENAKIEQKLFDKSFVFFDTLEEAISWAETFFTY